VYVPYQLALELAQARQLEVDLRVRTGRRGRAVAGLYRSLSRKLTFPPKNAGAPVGSIPARP
jgi:hypothetical protein